MSIRARASELFARQEYLTGTTVATIISAAATFIWSLLALAQRQLIAELPAYDSARDLVPDYLLITSCGGAGLWLIFRVILPSPQNMLDFISRMVVVLFWTYILLGDLLTMEKLPPALLAATIMVTWTAWCSYLASPRYL